MLETLCGAVVGATHLLLGHSLDRLKIKYQLTSLSAKSPGFRQAVRETFLGQGLKAYYKGASALVLGLPLTTAVQFGLYQFLKREIMVRAHKFQYGQTPEEVLGLASIGAAGVVAGAVSALLYCPIEYAKIQSQVRSGPLKQGSLRILLNQIKNGSWGKIYTGLGPTMLRQTIGCYFYFTAYEAVVRKLCQQKGLNRRFADVGDFFIGGAVAGFCYNALSYPWDYIKTRAQANLAGQTEPGKVMRTVFRGLAVSSVRTVAINAFSFTLYEQIKGLSQMLMYISRQ